VLRLMEGYRAVTTADIQRVAKQYLSANNRTVVVAAPKKPLRKFVKKNRK